MTYLYGPYFDRFGQYIQSLQLECLSKFLDNNWSARYIERCVNLRTLAVIGNGFIIQLNAIFTSCNFTLQKLTLQGFFMFPSFDIFRVAFPQLRSLTVNSVDNISSEDLTAFLQTNPNVTEIVLRKMTIDETSVPFMTRVTKLHFMLMKNFNAFNIDSLVVLPGLIDLKVTGLTS